MSPLSNPTRGLRRAILAAIVAACSVSAHAGSWPEKPITMVVPFPAGGGTDLVARSIQPLLQRELGQPVVIDNRSGAGGTLGSSFVARAVADGYTAGVVTTSTHAVSVALYPRLAYNPTATLHTPASSALRLTCWRSTTRCECPMRVRSSLA